MESDIIRETTELINKFLEKIDALNLSSIEYVNFYEKFQIDQKISTIFLKEKLKECIRDAADES